MKRCKRCNTDEQITQHHVKPLCHFKGRRSNTLTVPLCQKCHNIIETGILFIEARFGGVKYGTRFKLHESEYETIVRIYTKKT